MADNNWNEMASFLDKHRGALIVAPPLKFFNVYQCITYEKFLKSRKFDFFIIHKPIFNWIDHDIMIEVIHLSWLVWENDLFFVMKKKGSLHPKGISPTKVKRRLKRSMDEPLLNRKIVFVHVPKCAGRTLYQGLKKFYRRQIYLLRLGHDVNLQQNNFIAGHVSVYEYEQLLSETNCLWLTVLRDPIKRIASLVAHARRVDNPPTVTVNPRMAMFRESSIDKIVDSDAWFSAATQSISMLSGLPPAGLSIDTIEDYFKGALTFIRRKDVLFGIQEDMLRYYEMIEAATGLSLDATLRKNISANYNCITEQEIAFLDSFRPPYLLKEIKLYHTAKKLFYERYKYMPLGQGNHQAAITANRYDDE